MAVSSASTSCDSVSDMHYIQFLDEYLQYPGHRCLRPSPVLLSYQKFLSSSTRHMLYWALANFNSALSATLTAWFCSSISYHKSTLSNETTYTPHFPKKIARPFVLLTASKRNWLHENVHHCFSPMHFCRLPWIWPSTALSFWHVNLHLFQFYLIYWQSETYAIASSWPSSSLPNAITPSTPDRYSITTKLLALPITSMNVLPLLQYWRW